MPLAAGDFRLVDRGALDAFLSMREANRYLRGMFSWVGFEQVGVPYASPARTAGESKYTIGRMLRLATDAIVSFSDRPLRLALNLGFLVSLGSILFGLSAVVSKLVGVLVVPGWTSVMVLVGVVGGVQLIVIGIIGEYVGRISEEVKGRPLYVVRSVHGLRDDATLGAWTAGDDGHHVPEVERDGARARPRPARRVAIASTKRDVEREPRLVARGTAGGSARPDGRAQTSSNPRGLQEPAGSSSREEEVVVARRHQVPAAQREACERRSRHRPSTARGSHRDGAAQGPARRRRAGRARARGSPTS